MQATAPAVKIRRATPDDVPATSQICFDAFTAINAAHSFPPDIPHVDMATELLTILFSHPAFYCVVAEADGQIIGSNCLDERSPIHGIGPITIDPNLQNRGVGRMLMNAVVERSAAQNAPGVRLVQAAFHNRSLCLYASMGFDTVEPLSVFQGPAIKKQIEGRKVRPATPEDLAACDEVCQQVHGFHRSGELGDAIHHQKTATVVEHNGRITGYSSDLAFFGHTVAETNTDLQALIAHAESFGGPGMLVPTRNAELFRWLLAHGLRVVQPMTLMSKGAYQEPRGAFLPSILY